MSIQPSLSKSRKAQPAPLVSGRCFSADFPAVCTQVMPLIDAGTSSKVGRSADVAAAPNDVAQNGEAAASVAKLRRSRRRVISSSGPRVRFFIQEVKTFAFQLNLQANEVSVHARSATCSAG